MWIDFRTNSGETIVMSQSNEHRSRRKKFLSCDYDIESEIYIHKNNGLVCMHVVRLISLVIWVRTPLSFNGSWSIDRARQYFESSFILNLIMGRLMLVGSIRNMEGAERVCTRMLLWLNYNN